MKKLFLYPLNKLYNLEKIINICEVESTSLYRVLSLNPIDYIEFSVNNEPVPLEKNTLILYNHYELKINDNKNLKYLYKVIEQELRYKGSFFILSFENAIKDLIDEVSLNTIIPIEYSDNVDIQKILSSIGLSYKEPYTYIEKLISYIKIYNEINNNSLIISFGLLNMLDDQEIKILSKELSYLNIHLFDIQHIVKREYSDLIIDDDWCII